MKKLHTMLLIFLVTCILVFISTFIPKIYEVEQSIVPATVYERLQQQYQTLLPEEEALIRSIITLNDIENKISGNVLEERAIALVGAARTQLSKEEITLLATQFRRLYEIAQKPVTIKGNVRAIQIGSTIVIVLLAGIDIVLCKKKMLLKENK